MDTQHRTKQIAAVIGAVILWLLTISLGLEVINVIKNLFGLIFVVFGGSEKLAGQIAPWLVLLLGVIYLVFIISTTEFHRKRIGKSESWRLFGWSLAVEASLIIFYYLVL